MGRLRLTGYELRKDSPNEFRLKPIAATVVPVELIISRRLLIELVAEAQVMLSPSHQPLKVDPIRL